MKSRTKRKRDPLPDGFHALHRRMPLRPIKDDIHLGQAQELCDRLALLATPTRDQEAYLETLSLLIKAYEDQHYAIQTKSLIPVDVVKFLLKQHGLSASDLGRLLGQRQLGAKILSGKRGLSKTHMMKLAKRFQVSPALFLPKQKMPPRSKTG